MDYGNIEYYENIKKCDYIYAGWCELNHGLGKLYCLCSCMSGELCCTVKGYWLIAAVLLCLLA